MSKLWAAPRQHRPTLPFWQRERPRERPIVSLELAYDLHVNRDWEKESGCSNRGLDISQECRGVLRCSGIDVKTGAPFETRHLGQLGHNLQMPVVFVLMMNLDWRGVQHEVIRRIIQRQRQP